MEFKYSQGIKDENKIAKGMGIGLNISFKHSVTVCNRIRNMNLSSAINLLEAVISQERAIPFKRFRTGVGHRRGDGKETIAKYPWKASSEILKVLRNVEANANYKGMDIEELRLVHIEAQKGARRRRIKPRGRWKLWRTELVHIQAIAKKT